MADEAPHAPICPNCEFAFATRPLNYCPMCGQETNPKPPTLREFVQQFAGSYIAAEGALWRSLRLLLLKPGELTREYLAGRRRRYVLPLRLYLTISVVALLLLRVLTDVQMEAATGQIAAGPSHRTVSLSLGFGKAELDNGVFTCTNLPDWVCRRLEKRLVVEPAALKREIPQFIDRMLSNVGAAMFVLLPAFALGLKLVYRKRGMRYTEHLVFALHTHAFWFVMLGLTLVAWSWLRDMIFAIVPTYTLLAMRRVYGGRWGPVLLRAGVLSVLYGLSLLPTLVALSLWALLA